jgi:hypothetical protein
MKFVPSVAVAMLVFGLCPATAASPDAASEAKGKTCRMEQQCRWENFKKICVYVKVCR